MSFFAIGSWYCAQTVGFLDGKPKGWLWLDAQEGKYHWLPECWREACQ